MKYSIVDHLVRAAIFGTVPQKLGDLGEIVGKGGDGDQQVEDHGELPERSSDANVGSTALVLTFPRPWSPAG